MRKIGKLATLSFGSALSLISLTDANATSYQVFTGLSYSNPAMLNMVKHEELTVGGTAIASRFHFEGDVAVAPGLLPSVSGSTSSRTLDLLPYGRFAIRVAPKWVIGLDITQPYYTDIQYPTDSVLNMFSTETFLRDTNYSSRVSYQVLDQLAIGVGFDVNNFYNGQLNFSIPPFGNMVNKADGWAYGWDFGLSYTPILGTFINFSYFSQIVQHLRGTSDWGPFTSDSLAADVKLPATWILNVIQMLSPDWALSATARYTQWDSVRFLVLQNTALGAVGQNPTVTVPESLFSNFSAELATRYQINDKWAVMGLVDYEANMQPTWTRNPGLPSYTRIVPAVGAEYNIGKGIKTKLMYGHAFSKAPLDMSISTGSHIHGHDYLNADVIDFSVTYSV